MLHIVQQYAASKALRKTKSGDPSTLAKLRANAIREQDHNKSETALRKGTPARFGALYQVMVPVLDKYLEPQKSIANEDPTAMRLSVVSPEVRSKMSWFKLKSAFATRTEGEQIRMGDTVVLESLKMPDMFMRCNSCEDGSLGDTRELNIGSEPTRFKVVPVAKHGMHALDSRTVARGAQYYQIYQRDPQAYLLREDNGLPKLRRFAPMGTDPALHRADLTFQLEFLTMEWSGVPVEMRRHGARQQFCLRDAMSGSFLTEHRTGGGPLEFGKHGILPEAHWEFVPVDADTVRFVCDETSFWIKSVASGRILSRVQNKHSGAHRSEAMHGITTVPDFAVDEADAFVLRPVPRGWLRSFQKMENDMSILHKFRDDLVAAAGNGNMVQRASEICQGHLLPQVSCCNKR